jgi:hypothetical protein
MGERVVVNPSREEPARVVPLDYGHGSPAGDGMRRVWRRVRETGDALLALLWRRVNAGVRAVGGARQVVFAIGLASVLGGLGDVLGRFSDGAGIFWMVIGGVMIGLSVRFPWLR